MPLTPSGTCLLSSVKLPLSLSHGLFLEQATASAQEQRGQKERAPES